MADIRHLIFSLHRGFAHREITDRGEVIQYLLRECVWGYSADTYGTHCQRNPLPASSGRVAFESFIPGGYVLDLRMRRNRLLCRGSKNWARLGNFHGFLPQHYHCSLAPLHIDNGDTINLCGRDNGRPRIYVHPCWNLDMDIYRRRFYRAATPARVSGDPPNHANLAEPLNSNSRMVQAPCGCFKFLDNTLKNLKNFISGRKPRDQSYARRRNSKMFR